MTYLILILSAIIVNNIILTRFLGICPFLGVSKNPKNALGMSGAIIFVVFFATLLSYILYRHVLVPLNIQYLHLIAFILIIASFVQFVEMFMKKHMTGLYQALGIFLPLITTNCVVLTVALDVVGYGSIPQIPGIETIMVNGTSMLNYGGMLLYALAVPVGYSLIFIVFSYIQVRLQSAKGMPKAFQGNAIALITAGIMAMIFAAFTGMI